MNAMIRAQARQNRPVLRTIVRHSIAAVPKALDPRADIRRNTAQSVLCRETALITRILAGEPEPFHELVHPYERSVYRVALSILRNHEDAEEAAQDTLLKALRKLHTFRAESKFSTWLTSIAVNEARARLRRGRILKFEPLDHTSEDDGVSFPLGAVIADPREIPLQALERKELQQILLETVARLPENYRKVLLLRDVKELSVAETATALGLRRSIVKTRLFRARAKMRKMLSSTCRSPRAKIRNITGRVTVLPWQPGREYTWRSKHLGTHPNRKELGNCLGQSDLKYAACA